MVRQVISVLTCLLCVKLGSACMPMPGWEPQDWSMVPLFSAAPYVLYVEGVASDETNNIATFKVHCVLKTPTGRGISEEIYVPDVVFMHSCLSNPQYKVGEFYLTALAEGTYTPNSDLYPLDHTFSNYEPDISTRNLYVATEGNNTDKAFSICGLSATPKAGTCPPHREASVCATPAATTRNPTTTTRAPRTTSLPILNKAPATSLSVLISILSAVVCLTTHL